MDCFCYINIYTSYMCKGYTYLNMFTFALYQFQDNASLETLHAYSCSCATNCNRGIRIREFISSCLLFKIKYKYLGESCIITNIPLHKLL